MDYRFSLVTALLTCCKGESSGHGPPVQVLAFAGEDVILPCSYNSSDLPTVEWSKEGLVPSYTLVYRNGYEMFEIKNSAFEYRTSLIMTELKKRNISLRISTVRLSDSGKYICKRIWENAPWEITTVELVVRAVSEPKLSMVSAENGGVTLLCEASCWLPAPEIKLQDDQGNIIPANEPKSHQHDSGCHTVTRTLTLQDDTKRVTCIVHQPEINQTRTTEILLQVDCMRPCSQTTCIAVGVVVPLLALCGLTVLLRKRCGKSAGALTLPVRRQSSDQTTVSAIYEHQSFLQSFRIDNMENDAIEKLTREVADLKSKLHEKEATIQHLQNALKSQLSPVYQLDQPTLVCRPDVPKPFAPPSDHHPWATNVPGDHDPKPTASTNSNPLVSTNLAQNKGPQPGISCQNSDPGPDPPMPRKLRINSSPAVMSSPVPSSSSSNPSKKKLGLIGRSKSEHSAPVSPKLQRRHSFVLSRQLSLTNNRFALLTNLSEESE